LRGAGRGGTGRKEPTQGGGGRLGRHTKFVARLESGGLRGRAAFPPGVREIFFGRGAPGLWPSGGEEASGGTNTLAEGGPEKAEARSIRAPTKVGRGAGRVSNRVGPAFTSGGTGRSAPGPRATRGPPTWGGGASGERCFCACSNGETAQRAAHAPGLWSWKKKKAGRGKNTTGLVRAVYGLGGRGGGDEKGGKPFDTHGIPTCSGQDGAY